MANRTRKITTIEEGDGVELDAAETPATSQEQTVAERLAELLARDGAECVSRIYRDNPKNAQNKREFLERVDEFVEEDYLAENWGGGRYVVYYKYRDENGESRSTTLTFAISDIHKGAKMAGATVAPVKQENGLLGAFIGNMTAEKMAGALAIVEAVKKIFAPPPPPVDFTELIKAFAAPRGPSVGDAVLIKALEGVNRPAPAPAPSILTQIKELNEVKELLNDSNNSESGGDTMDYFVKMGLQMLPVLLNKNAGNFEATGAAVRGNEFINGLIQNDPDLAGKFINAAAEKYGVEAAQKLAAGFGYSFEPAQENKQIESEAGATAQAEPVKG